jgi:hypothetical protein
MRTVITSLVVLMTTMLAAQSAEKEFIHNLSAFCGKTFSGTAIFPEGDQNPFKGEPLSIHFAVCTPNEVKIPFRVGENKSRTWIVTLDESGLLLKHDHRHDDGTPDEVTMYGGYAKAGGTALSQYFPADAYTAQLIPAAAGNEWSLLLSADRKKLSYILTRDGQLRFHADFNLSTPVKK